jgi:hypothetical protein
LSQIQFLRQQLSFNPTHDGVVSFWNGVHALLQKRLTDPVTASSIAFQRQGLSETEANAAAVRNANLASQLDKMDGDTSAFTGEKAPSAVAQLQGILKTPYLTADVKDHAARNLAVAQQAVKNNLQFEALKKRQEEAITNGDLSALGPMLAKGLASWEQIVSTRKPEAILQVWKSAEAYSQKYLGKPFSPAENTANYKQAINPQVRSTLDMIQTMTDKGGSIAIAEKAAQKLPQLNSQQANAVFNAFSRSFGSSSVTNFHTAMLGLADEYARVMGSGAGTDTGRQQALDILKDAYSNDQLSGAVATMKADIQARKSELIRGNPLLESTYGVGGTKEEPGSTPAGISSGASNYLQSIGIQVKK